MRNKNSIKLKIVAISCFLIAAIIGIATKEYTTGILFLVMAISYSLIFLVKNKINLSLPNTYKTLLIFVLII